MKTMNEVNWKKYAPFDTMQELVSLMNQNIKVWSWGCEMFTNCKVNGHLFTGWIYLGVNGKDLFDIYFVNASNIILDVIEDVYVEDLIDTIDRKVEKIADYKW